MTDKSVIPTKPRVYSLNYLEITWVPYTPGTIQDDTNCSGNKNPELPSRVHQVEVPSLSPRGSDRCALWSDQCTWPDFNLTFLLHLIPPITNDSAQKAARNNGTQSLIKNR